MKSTKEIQKFVGFYLIEGFWADSKPDYSFVSGQNWVPGRARYWEIMEEQIFVHKNGDAMIAVYRDGMIAFSDPELSGAVDDSKFMERIEKYTEILNAIFLIFVSEITRYTKVQHHTHFEITHHDIVPITYENGKQISMGLPQKSLSNKQLDYRRLSDMPSGYEDNIDSWVDKFPRPIVPRLFWNQLVNSSFLSQKIGKRSGC